MAAPTIFLKQKSDHFTSLLKTLQWLLVTLSPTYPSSPAIHLPATGTFLLTKRPELIPPQDLQTSCSLFVERSSACPSDGCLLPILRSPLTVTP